MKRDLIFITGVSGVFSILICVFCLINLKTVKTYREELTTLQEMVYLLDTDVEKVKCVTYHHETIFNSIKHTEPIDRKWAAVKLAIAWTESRLQTDVIGQNDDVGIMQITPIFVREANRLQSQFVFTNACRHDPFNSILMFEIINNYLNPERCIEKAIKLHNPGGGRMYRNKVMKAYELFYALLHEYEDGWIW